MKLLGVFALLMLVSLTVAQPKVAAVVMHGDSVSVGVFGMGSGDALGDLATIPNMAPSSVEGGAQGTVCGGQMWVLVNGTTVAAVNVTGTGPSGTPSLTALPDVSKYLYKGLTCYQKELYALRQSKEGASVGILDMSTLAFKALHESSSGVPTLKGMASFGISGGSKGPVALIIPSSEDGKHGYLADLSSSGDAKPVELPTDMNYAAAHKDGFMGVSFPPPDAGKFLSVSVDGEVSFKVIYGGNVPNAPKNAPISTSVNFGTMLWGLGTSGSLQVCNLMVVQCSDLTLAVPSGASASLSIVFV